jgi:hypothetical protein
MDQQPRRIQEFKDLEMKLSSLHCLSKDPSLLIVPNIIFSHILILKGIILMSSMIYLDHKNHIMKRIQKEKLYILLIWGSYSTCYWIMMFHFCGPLKYVGFHVTNRKIISHLSERNKYWICLFWDLMYHLRRDIDCWIL